MTTTDPETTPWFRRPITFLVLALLVLAAGVGVGLMLSADDDGDEVSTAGSVETTEATAPPTTAPPSTTAVTTTTAPAEDRCVAGDQLACDELPDDRLDELCDNGHGSLDACQVLLAHQGDGVPDGPEGEGDPED
jgi:hypothetical protein